MASTVNFNKVRKNIDFRYVVTLKNKAGTAIDISQFTFFMDVLPKVGEPTPVLSLSLGSGLELFTDGEDGKLLINVDHLVMADVPVGNYKYDLVMVNDGASSIVMEGSIKVKSGVTEL